MRDDGQMSLDQQLLRRIADLEAKVDWLYRQSGHGSPYPPEATVSEVDGLQYPVSTNVRDLANSGDKMAAIRLYMEQSSADLPTAKKVIEALG
jgi:hypothetical protein